MPIPTDSAARAPRPRAAVLLACLGALACAYAPDVPGGTLHCSADGRCPSGLDCSSDGLCYAPGQAPPGPPGDVAAAGGLRQIRVSWSEPLGNGGGPILKYRVTGTAVAGAGDGLLAEPTEAAATFTGLPDGATYRFVVVAVNQAGTSLPSATVQATTIAAPDAPTGLVVAGGVRGATLDWVAPAKSGGAPVTGYQVFQSLAGGPLVASQAGITGTHAQVTALLDGGRYVFTVRALNLAGSSPDSAPSAPVVLVDRPAQPVIDAPDLVTEEDSPVFASVPAVDGVTYQWSVGGATIISINGPAGFPIGGLNRVGVAVNGVAGQRVTWSCAPSTAAGAGQAAFATSEVVRKPATPVISAPGYVTPGATGISVSVPQRAGMAYEWAAVSGGTRASPAGGVVSGAVNGAQFDATAAAGGALVIQATEVNPAGARSQAATASIGVLAAPVPPVITAPAVVTEGKSGYAASVPQKSGESYVWSSSPPGLVASSGLGAGIAFRAPGVVLAATIQLTVTATNPVGSAQATVAVAVAPAPVAPVIAAGDAAFTIGAAGRTARVAARPGMTYLWTSTNTIAAQRLQPGDPGWDPAYDTLRFGVATAALPGAVTLGCTEQNAALDGASAAPLPVPLRDRLAVASLAPADGATLVSWSPAAAIAFSRAPDPATVLASDGVAPCGAASIELSGDGFASCLRLLLAADPGGASFTATPSAPLLPSTAYRLRVTGAVADDQGVPLGAPAEAAFTTHARPGQPAPSTAPHLSSVDVSWPPPSCDVGCAGVLVSVRKSDPIAPGPWQAVAAGPIGGGAITASGLEAGKQHDLQLVTVDADGQRSLPLLALGVPLAPTGTAADFADAQHADNRGARVYFTWSSDTLYAAISDTAGARLLAAGQDALWVAIDTDPAGDLLGEDRTSLPAGGGAALWPFLADVVLQVLPDGAATAVGRHLAGAPGFAPLAGATAFDGGLTEVAIPAAALGGALPLRLAFLAIDATSGAVHASAPRDPDPAAIDLLDGGGLTASFAPLAHAFDPAQAAASASGAVSPLAPAAALVTFRVSAPAGVAPALKGSLAPLSSAGARLRDSGLTAGADPIWQGTFHFGTGLGGQELFFKLADVAGGPPLNEGPAGGWPDGAGGAAIDRVWTLSGATEALPQLAFGVAWSATHVPSLAFEACTTGNPTSLSGNTPELGGSFPLTGGLPLGDSGAACPGGLERWTAAWPAPSPAGTAVPHDFTIAPLQWRLVYDAATFEGGGAHALNDDVINRRTLRWTAGDGQAF